MLTLPVNSENVQYCRTGEGVHWDNISQGVSVDDNFALLHVILMLLLDFVIYACIAWYIEAVYPGEYGIPRPFYFPLLVSCGHFVVVCIEFCLVVPVAGTMNVVVDCLCSDAPPLR